MKTVNLQRSSNRPFLLEVQHVLSREGMGGRDKRLHCVLDWGYVGDLGMSKETGGPAFPMPASEWSGADSGMDLRDYFATKAMAGDWAAQDSEDIGAFPCDVDEEILIKRAQLYYRMADAMLKTRSK